MATQLTERCAAFWNAAKNNPSAKAIAAIEAEAKIKKAKKQAKKAVKLSEKITKLQNKAVEVQDILNLAEKTKKEKKAAKHSDIASTPTGLEELGILGNNQPQTRQVSVTKMPCLADFLNGLNMPKVQKPTKDELKDAFLQQLNESLVAELFQQATKEREVSGVSTIEADDFVLSWMKAIMDDRATVVSFIDRAKAAESTAAAKQIAKEAAVLLLKTANATGVTPAPESFTFKNDPTVVSTTADEFSVTAQAKEVVEYTMEGDQRVATVKPAMADPESVEKTVASAKRMVALEAEADQRATDRAARGEEECFCDWEHWGASLALKSPAERLDGWVVLFESYKKLLQSCSFPADQGIYVEMLQALTSACDSFNYKLRVEIKKKVIAIFTQEEIFAYKPLAEFLGFVIKDVVELDSGSGAVAPAPGVTSMALAFGRAGHHH